MLLKPLKTQPLTFRNFVKSLVVNSTVMSNTVEQIPSEKRTFYLLLIGKLHLIRCKLAIKPVGSKDSSDSSNGHDPKPGCCRSENRSSLLTTDLAVQRCRFDRFFRFVEWTRTETWLLSISLVTTNLAVDSFTGYYNESTVKEYINTVMNSPRSKNIGERGYKHMNIPCSKNIAC